MNRKNALYLALLAGISGLSPIAMAANPPAAEMDSAPVQARPDAAAIGGAELRSLATGSAHAPRLIELGAPDSAQAARPSLAERYGNVEEYAARIKAAADSLVQGGYLLPEDAQRAVARARAMKW